MSVVIGIEEYSVGFAPITGRGFSWTRDQLDEALVGPIAEIVFDDAGTADLRGLLAGIPDTDFEQTALESILSQTQQALEDWRVGEALAETYLADNRRCFFPWPDGRDEKKSGSSLPGADLVGFQDAGEDDHFAFGEVKTSSDQNHPPGIMYGRTGLKQQLEDLRDDPSLRNELVKYLGHRANKAKWKERYQCAAKHYLRNNDDVRIFGVMVRDVAVDQNDLEGRANSLGTNCPSNMVFELLAIYLPSGSISTLSSKVVQFRQGGAV
ncbi:MAG TPA: hypothetical protein VF370_01990 [Candidatus Cryosericum sp.]